MVGTVLVPLNGLDALSPAAFRRQRSKYSGREAVLDAQITPDGLLFNDTVHCAPLHPHQLYQLRARMGLLPQARTDGARPFWTPGRFFEVPVERLRAHATYWYHWKTPWINGYPGEDVALAPPVDEFEPFDFARYRELPAVPSAHTAYLEQCKAEGKPALTFVHIPHVLVAGPIETIGLRQISWNRDPLVE